MRRTQDLVIARLRQIALRWRTGPPATSLHVATPSAPGRPDPLVATGRQGGHGAELHPLSHPDTSMEDGSGAPEGTWRSAGSAPPAELDPHPRVWLRLLGILAVVIVLAAAGALIRSWPTPQPGPAPRAAASVMAPTDLIGPVDGFGSGPATPTAAASLVVHVVGEVREPGVVVLPPGSRVADAVEAAGGLRRGAELGATNLARILADGERVEIGGAQSAGPGPGGVAPAVGSPPGPVDLNSATAEQLDALPGIGPVTAAKILTWRATHGRFSVVDELAEVPGIGPKTLEELRPHVRV